MTQDQLVGKAGVNKHTVLRIEAARHAPRASTVTKLAAALDVPTQWLLDPGEVVPWRR
jgi:transcriptional regulator with XRE-family HTH domain